MKVINLIIIVASLLFTPLMVNAHEVSSTTTELQPIKKKRNLDSPNQSKAPSLIEMYFAYDADNGNCIFTLPVDVEYIDIELTGTDNQVVYIGSVDSLNPVWHQTLSSGEYYIVCTADNGDIYSGYIYI